MVAPPRRQGVLLCQRVKVVTRRSSSRQNFSWPMTSLPSLSVGNTPDIPPSPFAGVLFIAVVILRSHKCTARWFLRALDRTLRLRKCLDRAALVKMQAAERLGIDRATLYRRLRRGRCAPFPESARTGAGHPLSQPRPHVAGVPQRRGVLVLCR